MIHILWVMFNWPSGIVVGNLIASVLWASIFEWRLKVHHHRIRDSIQGKGN